MLECYQVHETLKTTITDCKQLLKAGPEGLIIFHMNICSIRKHFEELLVVVTELDDLPDVIVCTETRQINKNLYQIPGYQIHYNSGDLNQNDGVITYIRSELQSEHSTVKIGMTTVNVNQITKHSVQYEVYAIYKSPSINIPEFNGHLESFLYSKKGEKQAIQILIGDLNIDLLENSTSTNEYLNILAAYGYVPTINIPTRISTTSATCIDHCFIKSEKSSKIQKAIVIEMTTTDHYPIVVKIVPENKRKGTKLCLQHKKALISTNSEIS